VVVADMGLFVADMGMVVLPEISCDAVVVPVKFVVW